uniref:Uncharacterized protein n=1 Tax=Anopheles maculatus TaxID=74869 RepID=A0A182TA82_9DIPT
MSMWKGIGYNIDSAFQYRDGKTYFFKGLGYWRFNDMRMSIAHQFQKSSATEWMKCKHERQVLNDLDVDNDTPSSDPTLVHKSAIGTSRAATSWIDGRSRIHLLLSSCTLITMALSFFSKQYA